MSALVQQAAPVVAIPAVAAAPQGILQRQCACGGYPGLSGDCEECRKKRLTGLQRKASGPGPVTGVPPIVQEVLRSPGQPLDPATRAFMEPRFGHDFRRVRVHTDARAAESAREVKALAYTVGRDLVFDSGRFAPRTEQGKRLLGHELAHVVQQGRGGVVPDSGPSDPLEQAADRAADGVSRGRGSVLVSGSSNIGLARQPGGNDEGTPFYDRLNRVYQRALAVAPAPIRSKIEDVNDAAQKYIQASGITTKQIDRAVKIAEPVLQHAEAALDIQQPKGTKPVDPNQAVWLGRPPVSVQVQRQKDYQQQVAQGKKEDPSQVLSPPPPRQGPGANEGTQIVIPTGPDPAPTEFEKKLQSKKPFSITLNPPAPDIDPSQLVWLGQRPSSDQQRHMRFDASGDLDPSTRINPSNQEARTVLTISGDDVMPIRDPKTQVIKAYKFRSGVDTVYELDRNGNQVSLTGDEAPLEKPAIDPIDVALIFADVGPILVNLITDAGGKVLARLLSADAVGKALTRFSRLSRAGLAAVAMGTRDAAPILAGELTDRAIINTAVRDAAGDVVTSRAVTDVGAKGLTDEGLVATEATGGSVEDALDDEVDRAFESTFTEPAPPPAVNPGPTGSPELAAGMTPAQVQAARDVFGRPMSQGRLNRLADIWNRVANPGESTTLTAQNSRRLFNNQRGRFWRAVRTDNQAKKIFEDMGAVFPPNPNSAPVIQLPNVPSIRVTIDHIVERQTVPGRALDPSNLRFSSTRENTVVLRQLHDQDPFQR